MNMKQKMQNNKPERKIKPNKTNQNKDKQQNQKRNQKQRTEIITGTKKQQYNGTETTT